MLVVATLCACSTLEDAGSSASSDAAAASADATVGAEDGDGHSAAADAKDKGADTEATSPAASPAFRVTHLRPPVDTYRAGQPLAVSVTIVQVGPASAEDVAQRDAFDGMDAGTLHVTVGDAKGAPVTVKWPPLSLGESHSIVVELPTPSDFGQARVLWNAVTTANTAPNTAPTSAGAAVRASPTNLREISAVTITADSVADSVVVSANVTGSLATATNEIAIRMYLSVDARIDDRDTPIGMTFAPLKALKTGVSVPIPTVNWIPWGQWTLLADVDALNGVNEANEADNVGSVGITGTGGGALVPGKNPGGFDVDQVGFATYDRVPVNAVGGKATLDIAGAYKKPIRYARVFATKTGTGTAFRWASTDGDGKFVLPLPATQRYDIYVSTASVPENCGWSNQVKVVDNTDQFLAHRLLRANHLPSAAPLLLHASVGDRSAAPFAILDTALDGMETFCAANLPTEKYWYSKRRVGPVQIAWAPTNSGNKQADKAAYVGPPRYESSAGIASTPATIWLRGDLSHNADEYDETLILHEMGHHFATSGLNIWSPGGAHPVGYLDPVLALAEGFANAFAGEASGKPWIGDTATAAIPGTVVNFDAAEFDLSRGVFSERSATWALRVLMDDSVDNTAKLFSLLENGFVGGNPQPVTLLTVLVSWLAKYPADAELVADVLKALDTPIAAMTTVNAAGDVEWDPYDVDGDVGAHYSQHRKFQADGVAAPPQQPAAFWWPQRNLTSGVPTITAFEGLLSTTFAQRRRYLVRATRGWTRIGLFADGWKCDSPLKVTVRAHNDQHELAVIAKREASVAEGRCAHVGVTTTPGELLTVDVELTESTAKIVPFALNVY